MDNPQAQMAVPSSLMPHHHVDNLPVEVVQKILGFLPDIESVANASMSCWQWQNGFRAYESQILEKVLIRVMGDLADLHPAAIEALQIPYNQDLTDLASILSFLPTRSDDQPCPHRERLVVRARNLRGIQAAMGLAPADPEKKFDLLKGPYNLKRALDMTQTHRAHRKIVDQYLAHRPRGVSTYIVIRISARSHIETALWHFESFCRLFGGQSWYQRWGKSVTFATIIKAFWESFTPLEEVWIRSAHKFLVDITGTALQKNKARAMRPACVTASFSEPCTCQLCQARKREIEGSIAAGLVGILAHRSDDFVPRRRKHPFFMADFIEFTNPE